MKKELKNLFIGKFILGLISGFLLVAFPLYLSSQGYSLSNIGYVFGISMIFYGFLSFYFGSYSEYSGRLLVGIISIIVMISSIILLGLSPFLSFTFALVILVISKILFSLSESILRNITKIRVLDLTHEKELGSGFGLLILFDSLGYGIGLLFGGIALSVLSFQNVLFGLIILLLISLFFYNKSGDISYKAEKTNILNFSNFIKTSYLFKLVLLFNTILLLPAFLVDFLGLPLFQKEVLGMSNEHILIFLGIAWIVYGLASRYGGGLYDKYGNKIFIISFLLIGTTSIFLAFVKDALLFSIILIVDYLFFALADPARFALSGIVSKENKGMLMSFFELFAIIPAAVAILFFEKLVNLFGFEFIFIFRGLIQFISIFLLIYINNLMKNK